MLLGASENEIALVAFLLIVVLLATQVTKIGEAIGGLFQTSSGASDEGAPEDTAEPREDRRET